MPIETVTTITQGSLTVGVSKTLDALFSDGDLTPQELAKFSYCAWNSLECNAVGTTTIDVSTQQGAAITQQMSYFVGAVGGDDYVSVYNNNRYSTNRLYAFNVLLTSRDYYNLVTSDNANNFRVVTDIDLTDCAMTLRNAPSVDQTISVNYGDFETFDFYNSGADDYNHDDTKLKHWKNEYGGYWETLSNIRPYCVITNDTGTVLFITKGSFFMGTQSPSYSSQSFNLIPSQSLSLPYGDMITQQKWYYGNGDITDYTKTHHLLRWVGNDKEIPNQVWARGTKLAVWDYDENFAIVLSQTNQVYGIANDNYWQYPKNLNVVKRLQACVGLKIYIGNNKTNVIKPIIENGLVVGYSENIETPSEVDNITNVTGNNISPFPPSPIGGDNENKEIEMPLAYIGGTGGFVQFIKINSAGLASADDISAALSRFDITTIGKDLLRNFVSYKCFAVLNIDPDDTVTRQITVDGHGLTDENDQPLNGQVIGSVLPIDFTIGTPARYFNDFRDYAPYTKIEAYVPFCGWFSLPPWCIGHKITGTMFTDLYNGTVKAVIFAGQTVVAEVGGCCAYDIPFVADATGAKAGAVISSALSTAAATAATVSIPNVATGISAVTSAANTICAINSNDTTLKGVLGDGSNLNGLLHCYLKVTRPQSPTRTNVIPDTYKHEIGIPTCKEITLASGDGYTQIMDANIEGSMTAREKQMIIDGFRHGLIL